MDIFLLTATLHFVVRNGLTSSQDIFRTVFSSGSSELFLRALLANVGTLRISSFLHFFPDVALSADPLSSFFPDLHTRQDASHKITICYTRMTFRSFTFTVQDLYRRSRPPVHSYWSSLVLLAHRRSHCFRIFFPPQHIIVWFRQAAGTLPWRSLHDGSSSSPRFYSGGQLQKRTISEEEMSVSRQTQDKIKYKHEYKNTSLQVMAVYNYFDSVLTTSFQTLLIAYHPSQCLSSTPHLLPSFPSS